MSELDTAEVHQKVTEALAKLDELKHSIDKFVIVVSKLETAGHAYHVAAEDA